MKRYLIVATVLLLVLSGSIAIAGSDDVFYACEKNGKVIPGSILHNEEPNCTGGSTLVSWNAEGPAGPPGVLTHYSKYATSEPIPPNTGTYNGAVVYCDDGDEATGGGYAVGPYFEVALSTPYPTASDFPPTGWYVTAKNTSSFTTTFQVYVVCADMTL